MDPPTACRVLGVGPTPTMAEVERAFRTGANRLHPDHGGDSAKFQALVAARDALRNVLDDLEPGARYPASVVGAPHASVIDQLLRAPLRRLVGRKTRRVV